MEKLELVVQGVTSLMDFSIPWSKLDGVGSSHFSKLFSTQSIMASPFLQVGLDLKYII